MEKQKKKHGCLIPIVVVIVLIIIIAAVGGGSGDKKTEPDTSGNTQTVQQTDPNAGEQSTEPEDSQFEESTEPENSQSEHPSEPQITSYNAGMSRIGTDMPAGEYLLVPNSFSAYYSVASDSSGALDSIVSNDNFSGTRYITVSDGQYLKLSNCDAYPVEYVTSGVIKNDNLSNGMYKVGVDIQAGEYNLTTEGNGYYAVCSDSSGTLDAIITNDNFESNAYITVSDGQYLILSRASISQ